MRATTALVVMAIVAAGCGHATDPAQLSQARLLSADVIFQFNRATDASNRAAMADRNVLLVASATEAEAAKTSTQKDVDALRPLLRQLSYPPEMRLLEQFDGAFATYSTLDRTVLDLAAESTNVKAQELSLGAGQTAAEEFRAAVDAVAPAHADRDAWQTKASAVAAVSAVREVQVLQAAHIPNPDDAAMTAIEGRMNAELAAARGALAALTPLSSPASRDHVAAATAALDRFAAVNADIVGLSRRNSNVRSRALSLDQKQKLIEPCLTAARALYDALARRNDPVGR